MYRDKKTTRVLAISSAGGHWEQLMQLVPAFEGNVVYFATTLDGLAQRAGLSSPAYIIPDFNATRPFATLKGAIVVAKLVFTLKPTTIISTGAAPGLVAIAIGKILRVHTIWIDSVANSEKLSLSGRLAKFVADVWLTQWEHLSSKNGPSYKGSVL